MLIDDSKIVYSLLKDLEQEFASEDIEYDYDDYGVMGPADQLIKDYRDKRYDDFAKSMNTMRHIVNFLESIQPPKDFKIKEKRKI